MHVYCINVCVYIYIYKSTHGCSRCSLPRSVPEILQVLSSWGFPRILDNLTPERNSSTRLWAMRSNLRETGCTTVM